jgi:hypothetical protein
VGDRNATGLRQLAGEELGALVVLHLQQHRGREIAGFETGLEGEYTVRRQLVHVERAVVLVDGDVLDRREPGGGDGAVGIGNVHRAGRSVGIRVDTPDVGGPGRNGKPFSSPT